MEKARRVPGGFGGTTGRFECWKPVIAAVNGYALGGLVIALACDIIIAADHAQFGLLEVRRGLVAGAGELHHLPRHVPLKVAIEIILTGKHITAHEAYRIGLVSNVVPLDKLMATAIKKAEQTVECAPLSIRTSKQQATMDIDFPVRAAISMSDPATQDMTWSCEQVSWCSQRNETLFRSRPCVLTERQQASSIVVAVGETPWRGAEGAKHGGAETLRRKDRSRRSLWRRLDGRGRRG